MHVQKEHTLVKQRPHRSEGEVRRVGGEPRTILATNMHPVAQASSFRTGSALQRPRRMDTAANAGRSVHRQRLRQMATVRGASHSLD